MGPKTGDQRPGPTQVLQSCPLGLRVGKNNLDMGMEDMNVYISNMQNVLQTSNLCTAQHGVWLLAVVWHVRFNLT